MNKRLFPDELYIWVEDEFGHDGGPYYCATINIEDISIEKAAVYKFEKGGTIKRTVEFE